MTREDGISDPAWVFEEPRTRRELKAWLANIARDIERHGAARAEAMKAAKKLARRMLSERRTLFSELAASPEEQ